MRNGDREEVATLVADAQAGDDDAFDALAVRYRPTALILARGVCRDRDLSEDAVQDGFLTAHRALRNLDDLQAFGPWLATIVRNRARRLAREAAAHRGLPLSDAGEVVAEPPPGGSVEAAIVALPEGIREAIVLYYLHRWSVGEVAALLERPATTIKWQLHAGRALLRQRWGDPGQVQ